MADPLKEKKAFEQALKADRYDQLTHLAFADWCDEHDQPELADFHRKWTPEWQRAEDRLKDIANYAGVPFVMMTSAVERYLMSGNPETVEGEIWDMGFGLSEQFGRHKGARITVEEFWVVWETWTRTTVGDSQKREPFTCCY